MNKLSDRMFGNKELRNLILYRRYEINHSLIVDRVSESVLDIKRNTLEVLEKMYNSDKDLNMAIFWQKIAIIIQIISLIILISTVVVKSIGS